MSTRVEKFYLNLIENGTITVGNEGHIINNLTRKCYGLNSKNKKAYSVQLIDPVTNKNMNIQIHRLMWMVHNGPIPVGICIVPKDGDKTNLELANFKAVTGNQHSTESMKKAHLNRGITNTNGAKLTIGQVAEARKEYRTGTISSRKLALKYGVSSPTMVFALNGTTWKNCPEPPVNQNDLPVKIKAAKMIKKRAIKSLIKITLPIKTGLRKEDSVILAKYPKTVAYIKRLVESNHDRDYIINNVKAVGYIMPDFCVLIAIDEAHRTSTNLKPI